MTIAQAECMTARRITRRKGPQERDKRGILVSRELSGGGFFFLLPNPVLRVRSAKLGKAEEAVFDSWKEEISVNEKEVKEI